MKNFNDLANDIQIARCTLYRLRPHGDVNLREAQALLARAQRLVEFYLTEESDGLKLELAAAEEKLAEYDTGTGSVDRKEYHDLCAHIDVLRDRLKQ